MPNRLPLIAVVFLFWATSSGAAEPTSAEGVYALRRPETLLAFRVDPWSERMHQIRGIGRVTIDGKEPTDVYFEILGTYRPSRSHEARGVLLYRDSKSTSSIPWQGTYDEKKRAFALAATVGKRTFALPQLGVWTPKALELAPPPPPVTSPKSSAIPKLTRNTIVRTVAFISDPPDVDIFDEKGEIDIGKVITHALVKSPDAPASKPPTDPKLGKAFAFPSITELEDLGIITAMTDMGAGNEKSFVAVTPQQLLDRALKGRKLPGGPIRTRAIYPELDQPRVLQQLTKPAPTGVPVTPPTGKTVPSVVGMHFEDAVSLLWSVGLNPNSVDCLGPAKDLAQAERVVSQTPVAGQPYPADGNMRIQWYDAMERPPGMADGFQPGDGQKVDLRFAEAILLMNGHSLNAFGQQGDESFSWAVLKLDEPQAREVIARMRADMEQIMARTKSIGTKSITVTQQQDTATDMIFEFSTHDITNRDVFPDGTTHYRLHEYRGFQIFYCHLKKGKSQPLAAVADTVLENTRRLIDLRFQK